MYMYKYIHTYFLMKQYICISVVYIYICIYVYMNAPCCASTAAPLFVVWRLLQLLALWRVQAVAGGSDARDLLFEGSCVCCFVVM